MSANNTRRGNITVADQELAALAKALGHPARVAILRQLAQAGECVCGHRASPVQVAGPLSFIVNIRWIAVAVNTFAVRAAAACPMPRQRLCCPP